MSELSSAGGAPRSACIQWFGCYSVWRRRAPVPAISLKAPSLHLSHRGHRPPGTARADCSVRAWRGPEIARTGLARSLASSGDEGWSRARRPELSLHWCRGDRRPPRRGAGRGRSRPPANGGPPVRSHPGALNKGQLLAIHVIRGQPSLLMTSMLPYHWQITPDTVPEQ